MLTNKLIHAGFDGARDVVKTPDLLITSHQETPFFTPCFAVYRPVCNLLKKAE